MKYTDPDVTDTIRSLPSQRVPSWLGLYPLSHTHLYEPMVLKHRPFVHIFGNLAHSSMSERKTDKKGLTILHNLFYYKTTKFETSKLKEFVDSVISIFIKVIKL